MNDTVFGFGLPDWKALALAMSMGATVFFGIVLVAGLVEHVALVMKIRRIYRENLRRAHQVKP